MTWVAKLREKISQPASTKQYISHFISLHFKPLFLVFISVLLKLSKESLRQGGLRCCSLENICLQCWLCFTCVEEKLEQNLVRKLLLLTLMRLLQLLQCNNCYSNFGMFVHVHRCPSSSPIQSRPFVIVASLMGLQKQDKGTTRVGKVQGNLRIGSCLRDKVLFWLDLHM